MHNRLQQSNYKGGIFISYYNLETCECQCNNSQEQEHVHEFLGSTRLAEEGEDRHNHRFAGVTGEAIYLSGDDHVHELYTNTDFFENHYHKLKNIRTGSPIDVGRKRHVHFVFGTTTCNDGHEHEFIFATLIECPVSVQCEE